MSAGLTLKYDDWSKLIQSNSFVPNCQIIAKNGRGRINSIVLSLLSPFLKDLLASVPPYIDGCIILPDMDWSDVSAFIVSLSEDAISLSKDLGSMFEINLVNFTQVPVQSTVTSEKTNSTEVTFKNEKKDQKQPKDQNEPALNNEVTCDSTFLFEPNPKLDNLDINENDKLQNIPLDTIFKDEIYDLTFTSENVNNDDSVNNRSDIVEEQKNNDDISTLNIDGVLEDMFVSTILQQYDNNITTGSLDNSNLSMQIGATNGNGTIQNKFSMNEPKQKSFEICIHELEPTIVISKEIISENREMKEESFDTKIPSEATVQTPSVITLDTLVDLINENKKVTKKVVYPSVAAEKIAKEQLLEYLKSKGEVHKDVGEEWVSRWEAKRIYNVTPEQLQKLDKVAILGKRSNTTGIFYPVEKIKELEEKNTWLHPSFVAETRIKKQISAKDLDLDELRKEGIMGRIRGTRGKSNYHYSEETLTRHLGVSVIPSEWVEGRDYLSVTSLPHREEEAPVRFGLHRSGEFRPAEFYYWGKEAVDAAKEGDIHDVDIQQKPQKWKRRRRRTVTGEEIKAHPEKRGHIEKSVEERNYSCNQCDYQATQRQHLKTHILIKHEVMAYPCDQCDYQASKECHLKTHIMNSHDGLRYPCNQCHYRAPKLCDLKTHMLNSHEGIGYSCNQCDYRATKQCYLKSHIMNSHKGVWYPCTQCDYKASGKEAYKAKMSLWGHIKSKHTYNGIFNKDPT